MPKVDKRTKERPYWLVITGSGYRSRLYRIVSFPLALILWPILVYKFKHRNRALVEKEYFRAESWLFYWGWCVTKPSEYTYIEANDA
jgi:hypothetical protein